MTQVLYSLRTDGDQWRITKFVDGEVESSYLTTERECECPAGHRPTCRHRQMLPEMIARGLANTHWFWDFDGHYACDFEGNLKSNLDALNELAVATGDEDESEYEFAAPEPEPKPTTRTPLPSRSWRRL